MTLLHLGQTTRLTENGTAPQHWISQKKPVSGVEKECFSTLISQSSVLLNLHIFPKPTTNVPNV